ncbi:MAG TPA: hypothetical protein VN285_06375 [Candidatus Deferrimicrobium sp.]|nr:hypothetical protein [Candidatus Deferrimicrobium sp.]
MNVETRHYAFLGLFVCVGLVMVIGLRPGVPVTADTQRMFAYIDSLPGGSTLMVSFDHEASSLPEIQPLALALLRHAFSKGHKLVGVAFLAEGTVIGYRLMQKAAAEYGRKYGQDYVYLGFRPQHVAAILTMAESVREAFPQDYLGHDYNEIECLRTVDSLGDVAAVISIADGSTTTYWMEYGQSPERLLVLAVVTAAMVTTYDPYLASGQMHAMVGGLRGAAEYERLINRSGGGERGMLAQSAAHFYVIAMIVVGNVVYFKARRKRAAS